MVSMVVAVCPLFPPATFVQPHDPGKPARYADNVGRNSTGQGATPLLSAGVLSNGPIRTPGPFRRGVLLSGGRRSATENGCRLAATTTRDTRQIKITGARNRAGIHVPIASESLPKLRTGANTRYRVLICFDVDNLTLRGQRLRSSSHTGLASRFLSKSFCRL